MEPQELLPELRLKWIGEPVGARLEPEGVEIRAGAATDWFVDPGAGSAPILNAPALVGSPSGDFLLSACVEVQFASAFDAGALVLFVHEHVWAKLCSECSPRGERMIVSVVTRGVSDDCNSFIVDTDRVWLRVSRIGSAFAFHASTGGGHWRLVRYFALPVEEALLVGFEAQSPLGTGCTASFTNVRHNAQTLLDIRSGV
jgi:regulation of enolase protein 1 (concanavalin A-like superfamily)